MAWAKAVIQINPASVGTGIKVSLRQTKRSPARMTFIVSAATAKEFGWGDKDGIEVLIGEAEHHGLIRLRKNKSAAQAEVEYRETAKGGWYNIKLGHQPAFVDRSEATLWCQWEKVEDGWIEVVLPKWADETAPTRKAAPPQSPAPVRPAAKQNVTAAIMGDPPPGRREMLEKIGGMKV